MAHPDSRSLKDVDLSGDEEAQDIEIPTGVPLKKKYQLVAAESSSCSRATDEDDQENEESKAKNKKDDDDDVYRIIE